MQQIEANQHCICSLGLAPECPAHPYRKRREPRPRISRQALKDGECPACVFIRDERHESGRHPLYTSDIKMALEIGPVFCAIPELDNRTLLVRGVSRIDGVLKIEVLEGFFSGVQNIWMDAPKAR